jgi:hypothetical protein
LGTLKSTRISKLKRDSNKQGGSWQEYEKINQIILLEWFLLVGEDVLSILFFINLKI